MTSEKSETVENWADNERGVLDTNPMVTKLQHGGRPLLNLTSNSDRIYFVMYGGPRRPNFSPFQGRSRAPSSNFRPRFESPGFLPPGHNVYPPLGQHFQPSQRPYGFMDTAGPQGVRPGFQSGAWQVAGPRQGFRPGGYPNQQRPQRGRGRANRREGSPSIEAYYRHSMVENPWRELEEKYQERNKQD